MSPAHDTAFTIGGFVVVLPAVVLAFGVAPFFLMSGDAMNDDTPRRGHLLVLAAVIGPPLVVLAIYLSAVAWASRAPGPTFYFPWIALALGAFAWWAATAIIGMRISALHRQPRTWRRDPVKRYAIAGSVHDLTREQACAELDGMIVDDRIGPTSAQVWFTPMSTPRRRRCVPKEFFGPDHQTFTVHPEALPPAWRIERSRIAPWLGMPGGGTRYTVIPADDATASFATLVDQGVLRPHQPDPR